MNSQKQQQRRTDETSYKEEGNQNQEHYYCFYEGKDFSSFKGERTKGEELQ